MVSFATYEEARREIGEARRQVGGRTVGDAMEAWLNHIREGVRERTLDTNRCRMVGFLRLPDGDRQLHDLTPTYAKELYAKRVAETKTDTHRNELALVKRAAEWWVTMEWLQDNPFAKVVPVGKRRKGKPQLRIDEARIFVVTCLDEYATGGENAKAALAVATTLLLGLRASECTDRVVRDLDDGGRVLWIPHGKTEASVRRLEVPEIIRPLLLEVAAGKAPLDRLWGDYDRHWIGHHVRRLCRKAGVPVIPPHGLRGLHATLAITAGSSSEAVSRALGHVNVNVTRAHYFAPGTEAALVSTSVAGLVTREPLAVPTAEVRPELPDLLS